MKLKHSFFGAALLGSLIWVAPALADNPVSLGTFEDWESFTYQSAGATICYVFSVPKKSEPPQQAQPMLALTSQLVLAMAIMAPATMAGIMAIIIAIGKK